MGGVHHWSLAVTDTPEIIRRYFELATVIGDFPGSPFAGLRYRFADYDDKNIRKLRIAP